MRLSFFLSFIIHHSSDFVFQENLIIHRVVNILIYVIIRVIKISIIKHYVNSSNDVRHNIKSIDFEIFEIFWTFFFFYFFNLIILLISFDTFLFREFFIFNNTSL
jgi:hypothetical protein